MPGSGIRPEQACERLVGSGVTAGEGAPCDTLTELSIGFPLGFVEKLIAGGLVGKCRVPPAVGVQVSRIVVFDGNKSDARGTFIQTRFVAPFHYLISEFIEGAKEEGHLPNVSTRTIFFMIAHGGAFPMAVPALANSIPGEDIASEQGLEAHIDAIFALLIRD